LKYKCTYNISINSMNTVMNTYCVPELPHPPGVFPKGVLYAVRVAQ
jgi:hypothetical protein